MGFTGGFSRREEPATGCVASGSPRRTVWRGSGTHTGCKLAGTPTLASVVIGSEAKRRVHHCRAAARAASEWCAKCGNHLIT
eukprot:871261-Pleurochrysis_carterae.AAC.1